MDNRLRASVQILERTQNLVGPLQDFANIKRSFAIGPFFQTRGQIFTFDEIHDQKLCLFMEEVISDSRQTFVL